MSCPKGTKKPNMVGRKCALGNKGGQPKKYKESELPKLGEDMLKYFTDCLKTAQSARATKRTIKYPFFSYFAREKCNVTTQTLLNYGKSNKKFFSMLERCREIRKEFLIQVGLKSIVPPVAFMFVAKNETDMKDRQEIEHSGEMEVEVSVQASINKIYGKREDST